MQTKAQPSSPDRLSIDPGPAKSVRLITPFQKDDDLVNDIIGAPASANRFHVWWLGQSGFLIQWLDNRLLFDPYLSDSLTKKYEKTEKPHVRMTELVVDPAKLDMIDVVTSSHNHTDHLDSETLLPLTRANRGLNLVLPEANIDFARERLGDGRPEMTGLDAGSLVSVDAFMITGVAAAHNEIERDQQGRCRFLGYVVRFGPFTVFHSGDTLWHDFLVPSLAPFHLDLMFLPINDHRPGRGVAGNLNGTEAAALAKACGSRLVIPCHYDMFTFNTESTAEFTAACARLNQPYRILQCGERHTIDAASA